MCYKCIHSSYTQILNLFTMLYLCLISQFFMPGIKYILDIVLSLKELMIEEETKRIKA